MLVRDRSSTPLRCSAKAATFLALFAAVLLSPTLNPARADSVNGSGLPLKSSGSVTGTQWTLSSDGYVGTYLQLSQATPVSLNLSALGAASSGLSPDMTVSIANVSQSFSVNSSTASNYQFTTPTLPAGTYFVRVQLDNQTATQTPDLTLASLQATGSGVVMVNSNSDSTALAAAQTYINNFRQGAVNVTLDDKNGVALPAGTTVQVKLIKNSFDLGSASYDPSGGSFYNTYPWLTATSASTGNAALAYKYQQFLVNNFNITEPENAGKWSSQESVQGSPNLSYTDQLANFTQAHGMDLRMHNLIWDSQQPAFVNTLFTNKNVSGLNSAVSSRVNYYIAANNAQNGPAKGKPRTDAYSQVDILNEGAHAGSTDNYISTLGYNGVASIYSQAANSVAAAGANTRLYTNEYNVLQNSSNPSTNGSDPYANWYLNEINSINNAGFGKVVTGVGSEFYVTSSVISPNTMQEAMQNLAVTGMPLSVTEFAIASGTSAANAATDLQDAFTMLYGNPSATTFNFWDFWQLLDQNDSFLTNYQAGALMDVNGNPTALYTNTLLPMLAADGYVLPGQITPFTLTTNARGQINFSGAYGMYQLTIDGQNYDFTSSASGNSLALVTSVPEPGAFAFLLAGCIPLLLRHRARGGPAWSARFMRSSCAT